MTVPERVLRQCWYGMSVNLPLLRPDPHPRRKPPFLSGPHPERLQRFAVFLQKARKPA